MNNKSVKSLAVICMACLGILMLIYCSSPSEPNTPDEETVKTNPSFASDIQPIFNSSCTAASCHGSSASAGLNLTSSNSYSNLVNVNSTQEPNFVRVLPDDADNSYLVIKLEGNQSVGDRMPLNASPLSSVRIQNIRNWINNGANNN